jgi:pyruvate ferredoxin oxidoreductase gamma subunit
MVQVLWHGRGGQGAFTAARILGAAYALGATDENGRPDASKPARYALAFPSFGPERRGAPMRAFTKLADTPIHDRSAIKNADFTVFLDETLHAGEFHALVPGPEEYACAARYRLPAVNTVMLGRLAARMGIPGEQIERGIRLVMPERVRERNVHAVREVMR